MAYIYKIKNDINNKVYIGKTNFTLEQRFIQHKKNKNQINSKNRPLYNAMNKYGVNHFTIEKVEECSEDILSEREQYWIQYYDSYNKGYNATLGGEGTRQLDYDLICKVFQKTKSIQETSKIIGCSRHSVRYILKAKGIEKDSQFKTCNKKVAMIDKNTNITLKIFNSISDANKFLGKNYKSGMISEVCRGKRSTAYGFKWQYVVEE